MSTIAVKDLVPGTSATSADVNSTLTSINTACAALALGSDNVRVEGIDRRTMARINHVVETGSTVGKVSVAAYGPVQNLTGTPVALQDGAGNPMQTTADVTVASPGEVNIHASVMVECVASNAAAPFPMVIMVLQRSVDAGATWVTLTGSRRRFRMRNVTTAFNGSLNGIPGVSDSVSWASNDVALLATSWRIAFETVSATGFTFLNSEIFPVILAR